MPSAFSDARRRDAQKRAVDGGRGWSQRSITLTTNTHEQMKLKQETTEKKRQKTKTILNTVPREPNQFNICEETAELLVLPKSIYELHLKPLLLSKYQHRVNPIKSLVHVLYRG